MFMLILFGPFWGSVWDATNTIKWRASLIKSREREILPETVTSNQPRPRWVISYLMQYSHWTPAPYLIETS